MPEIFLSYDRADEYWRTRFDDVFGRDRPYRSVRPSQVPTEDGAEYGRLLREKGYLDAETVVMVLIGPKTFSSRKVDWEIAAAFGTGDSRPSGVLAVRLPNHEDYKKPSVNPRRIPQRLADNLRTGYLKLYDWTESLQELNTRLYAALKEVRTGAAKLKNDRPLMAKDMLV